MPSYVFDPVLNSPRLLDAGAGITLSEAVPGLLTLSSSAGVGDVSADTIWDTKGDLAVGTGADTAAVLPAGTDGWVLTANSATGTGLEWAAISAGGSVDGSGSASQVAVWSAADAIGGSVRFTHDVTTGNTTLTQAVQTSGVPTILTVVGGAHTTLTASTEVIDIDFNLTRDVQHANGNIATQRAIVIRPPAYGFASAPSTITTAATLAITAAPSSANWGAITNSYAIWVQDGRSLFEDGIVLAASYTVNPTTPATGFGHIFAKTDKLPYWINDLGDVYDLSPLLYGSGSAGRVTFWSDFYTISSGSGFTFNSVQSTLSLLGNAVAGGAKLLTLTPGTHTAVITEVFDVHFAFNRAPVYAANVATVRNFFIDFPTYFGDATPRTITTAATVAIGGAPAASTNMTITNTYALWVQAGNVKFAGNLTVDGAFSFASYLELTEIAAPATPASGFMRWYPDSTQSWGYFKNDAGKVVPLGVATLVLSPETGFLIGTTLTTILTYHRVLNFRNTIDDIAIWFFKLPPGWGGRSMVVRLLWNPDSTNTGNVCWNAFFLKQAPGVTITNAWEALTANTLSAGPGVINRAVAVTLPAMSLATFTDGDGIALGIWRQNHASDTFTGVALFDVAEISVVG